MLTVEQDVSQIQNARKLAWTSAFALPAMLAPVWLTLTPSWTTPSQVGTVSGLLLVLLVAVVSYTDIRWRKIPNWATYTAFGYAVGLNALGALTGETHQFWLGSVGLGNSLMGATVLFLSMLVVFSFTGGGAGDVKLVACLGALLGLGRGLDAVLFSFVVAGVVLLSWGILSRGPVVALGSLLRSVGHYCLPMWVSPPQEEQRRLLHAPIPLAPFFAAGSLIVLFELPLVILR
jgi:Flp pilus assembly protein protease CpaA